MPKFLLPLSHLVRSLSHALSRSLPAWLGAVALLLGGLGGLSASPALAQSSQPPLQKLKVGFLRTYSMLPMYQALEKGYFKARGLDVNLITLNNGPAVASAVQSGSLDIGYAALVPIIMARSRGQDFQFFAAAGSESADIPIITFTASKRSGVSSFKDLAGKTYASNAASSGCELGYMDHAAAAGVPLNSAKSIIVPFPQMQASLEMGNADIACTTEPFTTAILASKRIGAKAIAIGYLAATEHDTMVTSGYFASGAWLKTHTALATAFAGALEDGARDLQADPSLAQKIMISVLRFPPEIAAEVKFRAVTDVSLSGEDLAPLISAMKRHDFIANDVAPQDMGFTLPPRR